MTTTPIRNESYEIAVIGKRLIHSILESYSSKLTQIDDKLDKNLTDSISDVKDEYFVHSTIGYWSQKFEKQISEQKKIEGFLFTKLLEIGAFNIGNKIGKKPSIDMNHVDPLGISKIRSKYPLEMKSLEMDDKKNFAVVAPVYIHDNKGIFFLNRMLDSLGTQTIPPTSIFLIDDCSPIKIKIPNSVKPFTHLFSSEHQSGPAHARNVGAEMAIENNSDIIIFADYDMIFPKLWMHHLQESLKSHFGDILSGLNLAYGDTWWDWYHDINGSLNGRVYPNHSDLLFATTAALAVKKRVFEKMKFNRIFTDAAGEDIDFCLCAKLKGFKIEILNNLRAYHDYGYLGLVFKDLETFINRLIRYGISEPTLSLIHPSYPIELSKTVEVPNPSALDQFKYPDFPFKPF